MAKEGQGKPMMVSEQNWRVTALSGGYSNSNRSQRRIFEVRFCSSPASRKEERSKRKKIRGSHALSVP